MSRPDLWYRANVFAGWSLILASVITAAIIIFVRQLSAEAAALVLTALILCATAASFAYLKRIG